MKRKITQKLISLFLTVLIIFSFGFGCNSHEHVYAVKTVPSTCIKSGYTLHICKCGEKYVTDITDALGHVFTDYYSDGNATQEKDGTKTATCNRYDCFATHTLTDEGSKLQEQYTVTLKREDGSVIKTFNVDGGKPFATPEAPVKANYIFTGWYDTENQIYDFSKSAVKNLTLTAKYQLDGLKITNTITTDIIKGVVKIYCKNYNTNFIGVETGRAVSQGSGFCFQAKDGRYYILTNCHVAFKDEGYAYQEFTIIDYQTKEYKGYLYSNAISADYDLACLYFDATETNVKPLTLANDNPIVTDDIIVVGAPKGQSNAIAFGKITAYSTIKVNNVSEKESNIKFDVINSNAHSDNGGSGGPAFNSSLEVIGVTYAGSKSANIAYQIPVLKVREFLTTFVYS